MIYLSKFLLVHSMLVLVLLSCKSEVNVSYKRDKIPPTSSFSVATTTMNGAQTFSLDYDAEDNISVKSVEFFYTPDFANDPYVKVGEAPAGTSQSVDFCVPNKSHPAPAFKMVTTDESGNKVTEFVGESVPLNIVVTLDAQAPPIETNPGPNTNVGPVDVLASACPTNFCPADSLKYGVDTNTVDIMVKDTNTPPAYGDAGWTSCSAATIAGFTQAAFGGDGNYTYYAWARSTDTDVDASPINSVSSVASTTIAVYDTVAPTGAGLVDPQFDDSHDNSGSDIPISWTPFVDPSLVDHKIKTYTDSICTAGEIDHGLTGSADPFDSTIVDGLTPGTYWYTVEAFDQFGQSTVSPCSTDFIVIDFTPPAEDGGGTNPTFTNNFNTTGDNIDLDWTDFTDTYLKEYFIYTYSDSACTLDEVNHGGTSSPTSADNTTISGLGDGQYWVIIEAVDEAGNTTRSPCSTDFIEVDKSGPTVASGGNVQFTNNFDNDANDIVVTWDNYSDPNTVSDHQVITYTDAACTLGEVIHPLTGSATNTDTSQVDGLADGTYWAKVRVYDSLGNYTDSDCSTDSILVDTTPPDTTPISVIGSVVTGKGIGSYRLNSCTEVARVKVTVGLGAPPAYNDADWQTCDDVLETIKYPTLVVGTNNLQFWIQDAQENVQPAFIPHTTFYNPPTLTVENGPTISTNIADITINYCEEASVSEVLFNETSVQPLDADPLWQTCSKVIGALKSESLSPGDHTLKVYFKYEDDSISVVPLDLFVRYEPTVLWVESPVTRRPQISFTYQSCTGVDQIFVNQGVQPLAGDAGWQPCSTSAGAITYDLTATGSQTVNFWTKDALNVVSPDFSQVTVDFTLPTVTIFGGNSVTTPTPKLSIDDCSGIQKVFVKYDDSLMIAPTAGDFLTVDGQTCTTAANGIDTPTIVGEGVHTFDVWYQFDDNYIMDPWMSRLNVTYTEVDAVAPPITIGQGADTNLALTLENGDGSGPPPTLEDSASRAKYTLNTCTPKADVVLTGTVTVTAGLRDVTGIGTNFTGEISAGDFVIISGETHKVEIVNTATTLTLITPHVAGAAAVTFSQTFPEDIITDVIITESATAPSAASPDWQACNTSTEGVASKTLPTDGTKNLYTWFKDAAGNVSVTSIDDTVIVNTAGDVTPPDRPMIIVEGAPEISTSPAQFTIDNCTEVDQVLIIPSPYPAPYVAPSDTDPNWQNCDTATGALTYFVDLIGSYTLSAWYKDVAGNINPLPRDVSFIFNPLLSGFKAPVAYWSLDEEDFKDSRFIDAKGESHLSAWDKSEISFTTGKLSDAIALSGTSSILATQNKTILKPTIGVTVSVWAKLVNGDAGTKVIVSNIEDGVGGYGIKLDGGNLEFYASGQKATVATSTITTGWNYITGSSDGRYINLYINGVEVATNDLGVAANLTYGCNTLFTVGTGSDCTNNPTAELFDSELDDLAIWDKFFTASEITSLYIDSFNKFKPSNPLTAPARITSATFYQDFMQNAYITIDSCNESKFIYTDVTTHPPLVDDPKWQLCNEYIGGILHENLTQGVHELKIWSKDEYGNISTDYLKLDVTITSLVYAKAPTTYYSFDNDTIFSGSFADTYSKSEGEVTNATSGVTGIINEAVQFTRASSHFVESNYASNTQHEDSLTLSAWVDLTANSNQLQYIVGNNVNAVGHGYAIYIDNASNQLKFKIESQSGLREVGVSTSSYSSGLHQVVGSYDGQVVSLYVDGNPVATNDFGSVSPVKYTCLSSFTVGAQATCNNGGRAGTTFEGIIDEVYIWDTALASVTINYLFNGQDTIPPVAVPVTPKLNLYTIGVPIAKFNVSDCSDIAEVYVSLQANQPSKDIANWQTCSTSLDLIESLPLDYTADYNLDTTLGDNLVKIWFKDAAGNVSTTSTDVVMTFNYDFTIPQPDVYYTFDSANRSGQTIFDVSNAKDGLNDLADVTTGKTGDGLSFNGTSDFIEVPFDATFQPVNEITLSAWINVASFSGVERIIASNYSNGGYELLLGNNTLEFRVEANGSKQVVTTNTSALTPGQWYHMVGIYESGTMKLYIDSVELVNDDKGTFPIDYVDSNSFLIGAAATSTTGNAGSFFAGEIDEVAMWATAMSQTVVDEMYQRGMDNDKMWYDITAPTIPVSLNISYYNSLVSRSNLTISDCTGMDYIIVTKNVFPPAVDDENWQLCNTLKGGVLSKELELNDDYGKLWTKDLFGNISSSFEYVPVVTDYPQKIARPKVHWSFDTEHYDTPNREVIDRVSGIRLKNDRLSYIDSTPNGVNCDRQLNYDPTGGEVVTGGAGVLNEGLSFTEGKWLRSNYPANVKTRPENELSVSTWVYLTGSTTHSNDHIVSNEYGGKGWAIRLDAVDSNDRGLRFTVHTTGGTLEPYLETKNYTTGWHLVTGTYDGQTASLYFDGIFVKSFSNVAPESITYETGSNTIVGAKSSLGNIPTGYKYKEKLKEDSDGCYSEDTLASTFFNGDIDEVLVWDTALDNLEVSSLYHNGADKLYVADTTPPALPNLTLENTRNDLFVNKAYFTLNTCSDISGVLVNEGTQPDKQDANWEVCRTRRGSFGYEGITGEGGHTITTWYKDLAGNVTPISADLVINYTALPLPIPNAYWPLDKASSFQNQTRDVVAFDEHDLVETNMNTSYSPTATYVSAKREEGASLTGSKSYLSRRLTTLLSPVNFMTVGGWFNLTSGDAGTKKLIDSHRINGANRTGYYLGLSGGNLTFRVELDIAGAQSVSFGTGGYATGWRHVIGVWTGLQLKIYIDGVEVAASAPLPEKDFIRYDEWNYFRIGADADMNNNATSFLNSEVDEVVLYGVDVSDAVITDLKTKGDSGTAIMTIPAPIDVDNAYVYHYDNMGSRARVTMLNCDDTPWIFINEEGGGAPSGNEDDWRKCLTTPGAIISAKLPVSTQYVEVYSKDTLGNVSTGKARLEITPITDAHDLKLPIFYSSFNTDHSTVSETYDYEIGIKGTVSGSSNFQANLDGQEYLFDNDDDYIYYDYTPAFDFKYGFTFAIWAEITQGEAATRKLLRRRSVESETAILLDGGKLRFKVNVIQPGIYSRGSDYTEASFDTSRISTGMHMITAQYDGYDLFLYIDGMLVATRNVGERNHMPSALRPVDMNITDSFTLGNSADSYNGGVDEFMVFNDLLTETEINAHYRRYRDNAIIPDVTAPVTTPNISVSDSTFGANWPTDNSSPRYSLDSCGDIEGVYITIDSMLPPTVSTPGWQICSDYDGHLYGPTLTPGAHVVKFWYKDQAGNITSSTDIDVVYTQDPLPTPIGYWSFDDTDMLGHKFYDTANQNNAYNYAGTIIPGKVGTAVDFDGYRRYVEIEHDPVLKPTDKMTVAFWAHIPARGASLRGGRYLIGNRGDTPEGFAVRLADECSSAYLNIQWNSVCYNDESYFEFYFNIDGSDVRIDIPTNQVGDNAWSHFVATFDGRVIKIYHNGVEVRSRDLNRDSLITYSGNPTPIIIGADASDVDKPAGSYFNFSIDELVMYDEALYDYQVTDLYNNYANNNTKTHDPGLTNTVPASTIATIHNPGNKTYGSRIRLTMSTCANTNMILVNDSVSTAPAANDENWQECNIFDGGILSAPLPAGLVTPRIWTKNYTGSVSATSTTANGASVTMDTFALDITRPSVHWTLDSAASNSFTTPIVEDALSQSDGVVDGTSPPISSAAILENGFSFNGVDESITAHTTAATNPFYTMTLAAWVELKRGDTVDQSIVGNIQNMATDDNAGTGFRIKDGELQFYVTTLSGSTRAVYTVGIDTNLYKTGFHHIAGVYDGVDLKLYIDGVFVAETFLQLKGAANFQIYHDDTSYWTIGADSSDAGTVEAGTHFNGIIDEVQIWHDHLTEQQVYYVFDYGASFVPTNTSDGVAPTDPGIFIADGKTVSNMPWIYFTMPTCTGGNAVDVNAIYINSSVDPAPSDDDLGWQYCTLDSGYNVSDLIDEGSSTINVYFRDEEGDISAPTSFNVNYVPPVLTHPDSYYTFDSADRSGASQYTPTYYDSANDNVMRSRSGTSLHSRWITGKSGEGLRHQYTDTSTYFTDHTSAFEYDAERDFAISFWYRPEDTITGDMILLAKGDVNIWRTANDDIKVTGSGINNLLSNRRLKVDQWAHLSFVRQARSLKIYINGQLDSSHTVSNFNLQVWNSRLKIGVADGGYDELVMYKKAIPHEEVALIYYKGYKDQKIPLLRKNIQEPSIPDVYYTFDDTTFNFVTGEMTSTLGGVDFDISTGVTTSSDAKVGQSLSLTRYEDQIVVGGGGDETGANTVGPAQFLQSKDVTTFNLANNFTIAGWLKMPTKSTHTSDQAQSILSLWSNDNQKKIFELSSGASGSSALTFYYLNTNHFTTQNVSYSNTSISGGSDWAHFAIRRDNSKIVIFINGIEVGAKLDLFNQPLKSATNDVKLKIGTSGNYGWDIVPGKADISLNGDTVTAVGSTYLTSLFPKVDGTVSVGAGSTTITGLYTKFLTNLSVGQDVLVDGEIHTVNTINSNTEFTITAPHAGNSSNVNYQALLTGSVSIAAGFPNLVGTGTLFTTELANGDYIRVENEVYQITTINSDTSITLSRNSNSGASGQRFSKSGEHKVMIDNEKFDVLEVLSDTSVKVDGLHLVGASGATLFLKDPFNPGSDEYAFNGLMDEFAIWHKPLTLEQINLVRSWGNAGTAIKTDRRLSLYEVGTSTTDSNVQFSINDCDGADSVWIGFSTDGAPAAGDGGWVTCSELFGAYNSKTLVTDALNTIRVWFKTGAVVDATYIDIDITHTSGDTTAPVIPGIVLETGLVTSQPLAKFTLSTCADIGGVYVSDQASAPGKDDAGWVSCTEINSGIVSPPLASGVSLVKLWFKDAVGNITISSDYSINYTPAVVPAANLHFSMNKYDSGVGLIIDSINGIYGVSSDDTKMTIDQPGVTDESVEIESGANYSVSGVADIAASGLTLSAWVFANQPAVSSSIISRWNEDDLSTSQFSFNINNSGRLCLSYQTVNSVGTFNTSEFNEICSGGKIEFASWNHVAVKAGSGSVTFYIDGENIGNYAIDNANFMATALELEIGGQNLAASFMNPFVGGLDEVGIWSSMLSDLEIETLYAGQLGQSEAYQTVLPQATPTPDFYWDFNDVNYVDPNLSDLITSFVVADLPSGTPTSVVSGLAGVEGESFQFNAENALVSTTNSLNLGTDFTISVWVNLANTASGTKIFLDKWHDSDVDQQEFKLYSFDNIVKFDYHTTATAGDVFPSVGFDTISAKTLLTDNQWTQITVVRSGTQLSLYLDGVLQDAHEVGSDALKDIAAIPLTIGSDNSGANFHDGLIDEVSMFKQAIDASQVANFYDLGTQAKALPIGPSISLYERATTTTKLNADLSIGSCGGHTKVMIQDPGLPAPAAGALTVNCVEGLGTYQTPALPTTGDQVDVYFGDGSSTLVGPYTIDVIGM